MFEWENYELRFKVCVILESVNGSPGSDYSDGSEKVLKNKRTSAHPGQEQVE
jgi:hypothetical protein